MAYETGTATNHNNLLTRLTAFLTADLPAVQQWSVLADRTEAASGQRCVYLRGPGLAGTNNIYVGIRVKTDDDGIIYHWELRGMVGFSGDADFESQVGVSNSHYMPLYDAAMTYHFFANGRHFKMAALVESTVWANCYAGFILPYALPSEYPYPLFIGANSYLSAEQYSSEAESYRAFWQPGDDYNQTFGGCGLRFVSGEWLPFSNQDSDTEYGRLWPYYGDVLPMIANADATQNVIPIVLYTGKWNGVVWGELDGVAYIAGHGTTPGDTITDDNGDVWVVFNGCAQSGLGNQAAFKREI